VPPAHELWSSLTTHLCQNDADAQALWDRGSNPAVVCRGCGKSGHGALIRCSEVKCKNYYHLNCAYSEDLGRGLSLEGEGNSLRFLCNQHFKEVTFCM